MPQFQLIALTPPSLADPSIAIAASRAGGLGVLDLEYVRDERAALSAIAKLAQFARQGWGLKLDGRAERLVAMVPSDLLEHIKVMILSPTDPENLNQCVQVLHRWNLSILLETACLDEAQLGEQLGVDGLIAKGHEAGGRVGDETTFILLQRLLAHTSLPVWAHGGIGLHSAPSCYEAGAVGVVLDAQLSLTRESALPETTKASIARMDGSETICLGGNLGETYRLYHRPGLTVIEELRQQANSLAQQLLAKVETLTAWRQSLKERLGWGSPERNIWLLGQDAAFAAPLAARFKTVGGVLEGVRQAVEAHIRAARVLRPLDEDAPLARSHGTRYPIVQGPMTRVSDTAAFATEVAKGGALPFLALALMRAPEVEALLKETHQMLGDRPWGVGILGFVPLDLRLEQLEVIRAHRPPFALIAGGRPDQALTLEHAGIPTYLHVPSPGLLKLFIENGARRFIFEGRECGGHVGPRSSFVLWNTMIDTLLESLSADDKADCHVLFAGGIHDAVSASMVATMAAPLAERGGKIGVLLGTAYLFSKEAVATRTIMDGFQQEAIRCTRTVLLESGPGHATRCVETAFTKVFEREKQRLSAEGRSAEEIRNALEELNLGRLRIASKGINRHPKYGQDPKAPKFITLSEEEQQVQGMYMIGQVAALRDSTCTIDELHREVSVKGSQRLANLAEPVLSNALSHGDERPCDVAIVGMACLLPKAPNLQTYWENILNKVDAITEIPEDRWDWQRYFDPDPETRDRIYSKWGGFLEDVPFDPMRYGMPPSTMRSIEPLQLLTLEVVRAALEDAGYDGRPFPRERASVILGAGGGVADLGNQYAVRSALPMFVEEVSPDILSRLPEWTEDSFAGILLNVAAGRVANRFDLGGVNYTVDAACASSLAAVALATRELEIGTSDMVIVGGVDTVQNPFAYLCFSKTHALSPHGRCRTFDESADGIAISEGLAVLVLKRLVDAERDGDRIYAVIKAVAGSSDGRDKGLTAPRPEGQVLALERAYAKAGFSPATVGLIEAHGTGTVAGDQAEVETLKRVFGAAGAAPQHCAIGSVKSMIGHTKCTAGVAGLIKAALALYHKVLPPTLHVERPNPKARFPESPFYVNTELRPWVHGLTAYSRRAGVSAFGFGGTNFHTVIEEYTGNLLGTAAPAPVETWPSELLLWSGHSRQAILAALEPLAQALAQGARPALRDLAYTLWQLAEEPSGLRLAVVAASLDDLQQKLACARAALERTGPLRIEDPRGIYFTEEPLARGGKVAFLFPGQGSQYPGMLGELAVQFPEVRERFELADRVLMQDFPRRLSAYVFPPPCFGPEEEQARQHALTQTNVAQPALGAADMGLSQLLQVLGARPDMVAGHSYGEYVALCSAGVFNEEVLYMLSEARGRCILEAAAQDLGTMAAVAEGRGRLGEVLKSIDGVWIANINAPHQTVISGTRQGTEQAIEHLAKQGIQARPIPVACAFHSPIVAPARDRLEAVLSGIEFNMPHLQVFSNATASPYPEDPKAIAALLADHLVNPVRFADEIEAMYHAGACIFIEVGPRNILTGLTGQILGNRPHLTVTTDAVGRSGITQLHHSLGQLAAHGVPLKLDRLYEGRRVQRLNLAALEEETRESPLSPTTWLVNGGRARPLHEDVLKEGASATETATDIADNKNVQVPTNATVVPTLPPKFPLATREAPSPELTPEAERRPDVHAAPLPEPMAPMRNQDDPSIPTSVPLKGEVDGVMLQFQGLMNRFLETQQQIMLAYLRGDDGMASSEMGASATLQEISTAPQALQPVEAPSPSYEQTSTKSGSSLAESAAPATSEILDRNALQQLLLELVSEKTGYPTEMLDTGVSLEADLGIDSIKRVEILGALERRTGLIGTAMEQVSRLRTLEELVDFLVSQLSSNEASMALGLVESSSPAKPIPIQEHQPSTDGGQEITQKLLQIVSERTGYPLEILDMDLNIEADLGIDSIKRVEILGALLRALSLSEQQKAQEAMENLTGIKTLRGILDSISSIFQPHQRGRPVEPSLGQANQATQQRCENRANGEVEVPRFLVTAVEAPLIHRSIPITKDRVFLITDDERGVTQSLAEALQAHGGRVAVVRMGAEKVEVDGDVYKANLTDLATVVELLGMIRRRQGPITAVIHLLPLGAGTRFEEMDLTGWRNRLDLEVKSLFHLAKVAGSDLKHAGTNGGGWLIAATSMNSLYGGPTLDLGPFFPSQGGVAGLVKTLALEWPELRHKVIHLDVSAGPPKSAQRIVAEIVAQDDEVEVGYRGSRRLILRPSPYPLAQDGPTHLDIDTSWVVLVTGGARGITAEVARELAARYQPTLLIVGRSPLPEPEESPETAAITSPQALKKVIVDQLRRAGQPIAPARVEAAYSRLLQDREIRRNLAAMKQVGASVCYYLADVRDESTFGNLIDEIYQSYGRIDGVIHGAGIIEDKLIEDKAPDSFDRVFDTKVISAFILSRKLRPGSLRFLVLFSSIAGRFGNRGQIDYAAANEVLNKLAVYLDRQWQGRVVSINWGPWEKTGMVSSELKRQFAERAVQLISPQAGRCAFDQELRYGRKGQVEVVLGGGPWERAQADKSTFPPASSPPLSRWRKGVPLSVRDDNSIEANCLTKLARNPSPRLHER